MLLQEMRQKSGRKKEIERCVIISLWLVAILKRGPFQAFGSIGEFLVFEAKAEILLFFYFFVKRNIKKKEGITFQRGDKVSITFPDKKAKKEKQERKNEKQEKGWKNQML